MNLATLDDAALAAELALEAGRLLTLVREQSGLAGKPLGDKLRVGAVVTRTISDEVAQDMIATFCDTRTRCLRRIVWDLSATQPLVGDAAAKTLSRLPRGRSMIIAGCWLLAVAYRRGEPSGNYA